jgi:hypothetical protein
MGSIWWIKFFSNKMQKLEQTDVTLQTTPLGGFFPTKWASSLFKHAYTY